MKCPVRVSIGFIDEICPPPGIYAAYNAIGSADKGIVHGLRRGHGVWPEAAPVRDWQENRFFKTCLLSDALVGVSSAAVPLKAALYVDDGCRGSGVVRWAEMLRDSPDVELKLVSGADIRDGALAGRDLLVMPGGHGGPQYKSLGDEGAAKLKAYVAGGGKYFGTCCGLAMALNEDELPFRRIKLLPFKRVSGPVRGGFVADVKFNARGLEFLALTNEHRNITYHNGPIVEPAEAVALASNVEVLATMDCELSQHGPVVNGMYGTPAAVRANYGKGEVLAFNCHPEARADTRDIVVGGIRALTGRTIALPREEPRNGREAVGFMSSEFGDKSVLGRYLDMKREGKVYVVPLTQDDVSSGRAATVDRIIGISK